MAGIQTLERSATAEISSSEKPSEDWDFINFENDWPFSSNLSFSNGLDFDGAEPSPESKSDSPQTRGQVGDIPCCLHDMMRETETQEYGQTSIAELTQGKKNRSDNLSLDVYWKNNEFENESSLLSANALHFKRVNISGNLEPSNVNGAVDFWENMTTGESSLGNNSSTNNTIPKENGIQIGDKGILKRGLLNTILTYFRCVIIVPVSISVISVILSVAVFRDKNFVYKGKPLVISFNLFEGLKCIAYLVFRVVKLYKGNSDITWNSWYAQFFVYYVMWLPISLGRIGILHNGLITLDRFFTVAFPLRRYNKRLVTCPKTCVAVIVVSMLAYQSAPLIIFFREVEPLIDYQKTFYTEEIISEIYRTNPVAFRKYWLVLTIGHALFVYIPLILSLVFNTLTIVSLKRHEKRTKATLKDSHPCSSAVQSRTQAVKGQTNTMVVVSSLVFAVLVLFRRALPLVTIFVPEFGEGRQEMHLYILMNDIFIFFDCVSPLVNIISYTTLSSQFRLRLKKILLSPYYISGSQTDLPQATNNTSDMN